MRVEPTQEVSCRGGVRYSAGSHQVPEGFGVLKRCDVLNAGAACEDVVGVREKMVRFEIRQAQFQQHELAVNGVGQTEPVDEFVSQCEAAIGNDLAALLGLESDAPGAKDGAIALWKGKCNRLRSAPAGENHLTAAIAEQYGGLALERLLPE